MRGYTNADILLYWEHGGVQEGWRWRGGGDWWALRAGALNKRVTLSSICLAFPMCHTPMLTHLTGGLGLTKSHKPMHLTNTAVQKLETLSPQRPHIA